MCVFVCVCAHGVATVCDGVRWRAMPCVCEIIMRSLCDCWVSTNDFANNII